MIKATPNGGGDVDKIKILIADDHAVVREGTRQLLEKETDLVVVAEAYDDDQFVFSLLEAGAAGYLLKSVRGHELVEAVRHVYSGESVLHPAVARKVLNRFVPTTGEAERQKQAQLLSHREMDVLKLAARGLSNQDIADQLCLSLRTVQAHLGHVFNKHP